MILKRAVHFGEESNRQGDVVITDYHIFFRPQHQSSNDVKIPCAVVERVRALPIDKNAPSGLRVPEGSFRFVLLFPVVRWVNVSVAGNSIYVEIVCKYFRTLYFALSTKVPPAIGSA